MPGINNFNAQFFSSNKNWRNVSTTQDKNLLNVVGLQDGRDELSSVTLGLFLNLEK